MEDEWLRQAKKRNSKVKITEVAIKKVPLIEYKGLSKRENKIVQELIREVLRISRNENDSNEVAITCALENGENGAFKYGIAYGDEHSVNVMADTESFHIIRNASSVTIIMLHNHPSTQTFSFDDLLFFIEYSSISMMVVVSNQGKVHYLVREKDYDRNRAIELCKQCINRINDKTDLKQLYEAVLEVLKNCSKVGLYYR